MNLKSVKIRQWILVAFALLVFGVFASQLFQIQIVDAEHYQKLMEGRTLNSHSRKAIRGEILDQNGVPIVINDMGYSVILDKAFLPSGAETNEIILRLMNMFDELDEEWVDTLPVTQNKPYRFIDGEEQAVTRLKATVEAQSYATAEDVMALLLDRYKLSEYSQANARRLTSVRYEMERRDFSLRIPYSFATDIALESVLYLEEHGFQLPGVSIESKAVRKYALDDLAPHILGSVGPLYAEDLEKLKKEGKVSFSTADAFDPRAYTLDDIIGKGGIESALEDTLRGSNGKREISTDSNGEVIESFESIKPEPGHTVFLTIIERFQRRAQEALEAQITYLQESPLAPFEAKNANAGAVVAIEVKTGKILALATYPTYTRTEYKEDYAALLERPGNPLVDRAVIGEYAPGSIYKPVTALAALKEQVITPYSHIFCGGTYTYFEGSGYTPKCLDVHGNIPLETALSYSCNIFFYESGRLAGINNIDAIAKGLGLGEPTGIEIYESPGQRSNPAVKKARNGGDWYDADTIQTAIGQFDSKYTPLQLANYAATIANRGSRMKLSLISEIRNYSREVAIQEYSPTVAYQMDDVPPEAFEDVIKGMVAASRTGSARGTFANYPIDVAAKTGTPETGGATQSVNSTFIAFAPADDPEIAVVVIIEKGWHGYTGASVAKAMFDEYFGYEGIHAPVPNGPDQLRTQQLAEQQAEAAEPDPSPPVPAEQGPTPAPRSTLGDSG